jgi:hypothetical protein
MTNMFDIFKSVGVSVPKGGAFSLFSGYPNQDQLNPDATTGLVPSDAIQAAYHRNPLWFNSQLQSEVHPVVESALYWPLKMSVLNTTTLSVVGENSLTFAPRPGFHWMLFYLLLTAPAASIENVTGLQAYLSYNQGFTAQICFFSPEFLKASPTNTVPIVGAQVATSNGGDVVSQVSGTRPIYLGNQLSLTVEIDGYPTPGDNLVLSGLYLELPENQPMTALMGTL